MWLLIFRDQRKQLLLLCKYASSAKTYQVTKISAFQYVLQLLRNPKLWQILHIPKEIQSAIFETFPLEMYYSKYTNQCAVFYIRKKNKIQIQHW